MKKPIVMVGFFLFLLALSPALFAQNVITQKLATGTYIVYAASPQVWRIRFDPKTMANATISGHFVVTEGTPKTVDVLVFDEPNYKKWMSDPTGASSMAKPVAAVVRKSEGDVNATLTSEGYYYLVISDRFEYEGKKTFSADSKFQYD